MKILLVTDAWAPQVNGVARTLEKTRETLISFGHQVEVLSPEGQRTVACPGYPEIRLTLRPFRATRRVFAQGPYDAVHIATEGPLGLAARRWCLRHGLDFTTSYHTRFPEYLRLRAPVPLSWSYAALRWFHRAASRTFVRTETQRKLMAEQGFSNLAIWPGGVDTTLFYPRDRDHLDLPRPIALYMGRVSPEKNIESFLALDLPGSKVVIGGGPSLESLRRKFPAVRFLGYLHGNELAQTLSSADVFVFPSRTDTLGLVMLEAMACGVPVAAFPVPGPQDLVIDGGNGALDDDLQQAVFRALSIDSEACVEFAGRYSWTNCTRQFVKLLYPIGEGWQQAYNSEACRLPPPDPKAASTALSS